MSNRILVLTFLLMSRMNYSVSQPYDRFLIQVYRLTPESLPRSTSVRIFHESEHPDSSLKRIAFVRLTDSRRAPGYESYDSAAIDPQLSRIGQELGAESIAILKVIPRTRWQDETVGPGIASVEAFALSRGVITPSPPDTIMECENALRWYDSHLAPGRNADRLSFSEGLHQAAKRGFNPRWMVGWRATIDGKAYQLDWVSGRFFSSEVDSSIAWKFGFEPDVVITILRYSDIVPPTKQR